MPARLERLQLFRAKVSHEVRAMTANRRPRSPDRNPRIAVLIVFRARWLSTHPFLFPSYFGYTYLKGAQIRVEIFTNSSVETFRRKGRDIRWYIDDYFCTSTFVSSAPLIAVDRITETKRLRISCDDDDDDVEFTDSNGLVQLANEFNLFPETRSLPRSLPSICG